MSKPNKKNSIVVSIDELAVMSEDELRQRRDWLYENMENRSEAKRIGYEVELAYVQREWAHRVTRSERHREYQWREAQYADEECLPEYEGNYIPQWLLNHWY